MYIGLCLQYLGLNANFLPDASFLLAWAGGWVCLALIRLNHCIIIGHIEWFDSIVLQGFNPSVEKHIEAPRGSPLDSSNKIIKVWQS